MRDHERVLTLDYECLHTFPTAIHEVRVWWDPVLANWLVGKRVDLSELQDEADLVEPQIMEMIKHPNIVDVRAVAKVPAFKAPMHVVEVLMPYFEKGSITDALEKGEKFTPNQALRIIQAALQGLIEMHERHGILHRDVKSPNLFLTGDANLVKIGDLGLAGKMDSSGRAPCVPAAHLYAPPELMVGDGVTRSSDLYSLAVVLLELLAGKFDYASYTTTDVVDALHKRLPPLREADKVLPPWVCRQLRRLVLKAMDPDPARRFAKARDMSTALASIKTADWQEVEPGVWQAPHRSRAELWQVRADPVKGGTLQLTAYRRKTGNWRRVGESVTVPHLRAPAAASYFEAVNKRAVS